MFKKWAEKIKQKYSRDKIFDVFFLAGLCIVYSVVAFFNLGDNVAPQTFFRLDEDVAIILDEEVNNPSLALYTGITENDFDLSFSINKEYKPDILRGGNEKLLSSFFEKNIDGPFRWSEIQLTGLAKVIIIRNGSNRNIDIGELAFFDETGKEIGFKAQIFSSDSYISEENEAGKKFSAQLAKLSDERDTIRRGRTQYNSSYFDELYFAQTAYQYVTGQNGYEIVHPPLGKILQSIPIALTGKMTPFTWRLMGTLAGVFIIIAVYFLAIQIFGSPSYGRVAAILVSLSGLHFVQTRVGTVDSYLCLFTVLSYLFMMKFYNAKELRLRDFLLSGLFFGCAFTVKWSGAFGGIGLALIFFMRLFRSEEKDQDVGFFKKLFSKKTAIWIRNGIMCFIFIPGLVYFSSYLLFPKTTGAYSIGDVIDQGSYLYSYHSNEMTPHPYSSKWYTWPIPLKPMLYYSNDGKKIHLVGNYALAYTSIAGLIISLYFAFRKRDKGSSVIIAAWLGLLLPYALINRTMFLYHYLPASIFAILAVVNIFYQFKPLRTMLPYFLVAMLISFIILYPGMVGL